MAYVDAATKVPILRKHSFSALHGMLRVPAGSSGDKMTALLNGCGAPNQKYDSKGLPQQFGHLNLTKLSSP